MASTEAERRHKLRVRLDSPIVAKIGTWKVILLDISAEGARIEHTFPLARGKKVTLTFEYGERHVGVVCDVVRCKLEKHEDGASYCSGLRFAEVLDGQTEMLRAIIAEAIDSDFEARWQYRVKTSTDK